MGQKRFRKEYSETSHRRTFNIIHIKCVTGCCLNCAKRGRRNWYHIWETSKKRHAKYPNWKMVSKNKKQWMEKPLEYIHWDKIYTEIKW